MSVPWIHLLVRSSQPFNSHPWYLYPLYICNLAITIPLKCQLVILFFISRDLSISAGGRRAKHKRRKKMKAERSDIIAADQSCSQSGPLSAIILRTCNVCQQLYKCSGTRGRGLWFCLGWHSSSNCGMAGAGENPESRREVKSKPLN